MTRIGDDFEAWLAERIESSPIGVGCWEWRKSRHKGYGITYADGRTRQAHRVIFERLVGLIPSGLQLDHLCRNRGCVNPEHCEPVTSGVNTRRGAVAAANRARAATVEACPSNHPYSPGNTYRRANGHRICRTCVAERNRRRYA